MTLRIFTGPMAYRGPDRFDITRKSGGTEGRVFAPSWRILAPALDARRQAIEMVRKANGIDPNSPYSGQQLEKIRSDAWLIEAAAWKEYVPLYQTEMAESQRLRTDAWQALLARDEVTLVCYCSARGNCHRGLLAKMLAELGATDCGERTFAAARRQQELF